MPQDVPGREQILRLLRRSTRGRGPRNSFAVFAVARRGRAGSSVSSSAGVSSGPGARSRARAAGGGYSAENSSPATTSETAHLRGAGRPPTAASHQRASSKAHPAASRPCQKDRFSFAGRRERRDPGF